MHFIRPTNSLILACDFRTQLGHFNLSFICGYQTFSFRPLISLLENFPIHPQASRTIIANTLEEVGSVTHEHQDPSSKPEVLKQMGGFRLTDLDDFKSITLNSDSPQVSLRYGRI